MHPDILADPELRLVHETGRDLEELRGPRHHDLVAVEVGTFLAHDVGIEERRLFDLVELVLLGPEPGLPLLDLVAEGVEVPLGLPTETGHLLLEFVPDLVRRLPHLSLPFVRYHPCSTAWLGPRVGRGRTAIS